MLKWIVCSWLGVVSAAAMATTVMSDEPQAADSATPSKAAAAGPETEKIKLPPGFQPKKRGKFTLYCKTDTAIGTRFKSETCLDADQIRDYLIAAQENKSDVDRIRAACSNLCACGQPEAC